MDETPVIAACKNLFRIKAFLAHGIIPTLRMEDIKIALAKQLHATYTAGKNDPGTLKTRQYLSCYNVLADYIREHNLEVILALESYSNPSLEGSHYLYPATRTDTGTAHYHSSIFSKKRLFFKGALPPRKLRLGTFLYYKGIISYYHLMESIAWQKDRRPLLGQMAMQIGKLSAREFAQIIVHVKNGECFGTVAQKMNLLSRSVITALVKMQEKYDCKIGRYFTEKKLLAPEEILQLEYEMRMHNERFCYPSSPYCENPPASSSRYKSF